MPDFPQLSRAPALKTRQKTLDPTLRDSYDNGMESARLRSKRRRREWDVTIEHLTPADYAMLEDFVANSAQFGSQSFDFPDGRDPRNPHNYIVRFATLPSYNDAGNEDGEFRQNCTFTIREV